uniref:Uncharacterized protein n=1 Tax=Lotharella globosa TaxID=91324 RepID=A0A7S3ZA79_9EUKA
MCGAQFDRDDIVVKIREAPANVLPSGPTVHHATSAMQISRQSGVPRRLALQAWQAPIPSANSRTARTRSIICVSRRGVAWNALYAYSYMHGRMTFVDLAACATAIPRCVRV